MGSLPSFWIDDIISSGAIHMAFQPLVEVTERVRLIGYEMLARAEDAFGSPIPPTALFGSAHDQDRLFALDKECRVRAVSAAAETAQEMSIFVNFVPTSIYNPAHCLRTTLAAARDAGVDLARLVFEVVETDRVEDIDRLIDIFDYYRRNGARCALDDCGAGYNSVDTVLALRPDIVKLDRSICHGAAHDSTKCREAAKVIAAAGEVGAIALAEGVELEADAIVLRDLGCSWQQGYLYGRAESTPQLPAVSAISSLRKAA